MVGEGLKVVFWKAISLACAKRQPPKLRECIACAKASPLTTPLVSLQDCNAAGVPVHNCTSQQLPEWAAQAIVGYDLASEPCAAALRQHSSSAIEGNVLNFLEASCNPSARGVLSTAKDK